MLILFDNNVPRPLRRKLVGHVVRTAYEMNCAELKNGNLLVAAERARFDLFLTADQDLTYQQNLQARVIAGAGAGCWEQVAGDCSCPSH